MSYLEKLLDRSNPEKFWGRFTWPEWLSLAEDCFDFTKDVSLSIRKSLFSDFVQIKFSPQTLLQVEKQRLKEEYSTLCTNAPTIINREKPKTPETFWYALCTKEEYYSDIKYLLAFVIKPLTRTYNETYLESFFSKVKLTDDVGKPLNYETVENLCFIRGNGPHPLAAKPLLRAALNEKFKGEEWHFTTVTNDFYTSACVQNQIKEAQKEYNLFNH